MTISSKKNKKKESDDTFFLYVAIHSVFTALANLFRDD